MKNRSGLFIVIFIIAILFSCNKSESLVDSSFEYADKQLGYMLKQLDEKVEDSSTVLVDKIFPRSIDLNGKLYTVSPSDWCSGFFPGVLWYMYEYTKDNFWKEKAREYTIKLSGQRFNKSTHDLGFMLYCSYGNGYRLSPSEEYKSVLFDAAESLSSRYDSIVGCIKSWDLKNSSWQYPVIIDNMMNLELLFEASKIFKDDKYRNIAVSHAERTMRNHFRPDYSSYHVVDYDTITGNVLSKNTHQGYSDESVWARGQAWGLYGYTMCYRETGDIRYLKFAEKIADFILKHKNMPDDLIPYWDLLAPNIPNEPRDVSAAAIIASALYELSEFSLENSEIYKGVADTIMENLSSNYRPNIGTMYGFLLHSSTGHWPRGSEINVPIIYADYYYLEALLRKNRLNNKDL